LGRPHAWRAKGIDWLAHDLKGGKEKFSSALFKTSAVAPWVLTYANFWHRHELNRYIVGVDDQPGGDRSRWQFFSVVNIVMNCESPL
jgi:hypothetical protein